MEYRLPLMDDSFASLTSDVDTSIEYVDFGWNLSLGILGYFYPMSSLDDVLGSPIVISTSFHWENCFIVSMS